MTTVWPATCEGTISLLSAAPAFSWAGARRLSAVDVDPDVSNQHELGSVGRLHRHLVQVGVLDREATEVRLRATWLALADDEEPEQADEAVTCYDARRHSPHRRPEWRLYYPAGGRGEALLVDHARPGDLIVYAVPVTTSPDLVFLIAPQGSQWERTLMRLFPVDRVSGQLEMVTASTLHAAQDHAAARLIADLLGLGVHETSDIEWLRDELAPDLSTLPFPDTTTMAELARRRLGPWRTETPDQRLLDLLDAETRLFYALENVQALPAFTAECHTTDDYLELAKSLLQRRRSRRGRSFELHLETTFREAGLRFETQVLTEPGSKVDFLFPGLEAYKKNPDPLDDLVVHMNAKTTARERWRQILKEVARLSRRYLGTLDPSISSAAVVEMTDAQVQIVLPEPIADLYDPDVRDRLWTVADFIAHVSATQSSG